MNCQIFYCGQWDLLLAIGGFRNCSRCSLQEELLFYLAQLDSSCVCAYQHSAEDSGGILVALRRFLSLCAALSSVTLPENSCLWLSPTDSSLSSSQGDHVAVSWGSWRAHLVYSPFREHCFVLLIFSIFFFFFLVSDRRVNRFPVTPSWLDIQVNICLHHLKKKTMERFRSFCIL